MLGRFSLWVTLVSVVWVVWPHWAEAAQARSKGKVERKRSHEVYKRASKRIDDKLAKDALGGKVEQRQDAGGAAKTVTNANVGFMARKKIEVKRAQTQSKAVQTRNYASSRGFAYNPAAPASSPPPVPANTSTAAGLLTPPQPVSRPAKSVRPPGGTPKVVVQPNF